MLNKEEIIVNMSGIPTIIGIERSSKFIDELIDKMKTFDGDMTNETIDQMLSEMKELLGNLTGQTQSVSKFDDLKVIRNTIIVLTMSLMLLSNRVTDKVYPKLIENDEVRGLKPNFYNPDDFIHTQILDGVSDFTDDDFEDFDDFDGTDFTDDEDFDDEDFDDDDILELIIGDD